MNIEQYLNDAIDPVAIVTDLIEDFCAEYEENPLSIAHKNNNKKIADLDYLEPDDLLIDMLRSADLYIYNTYSMTVTGGLKSMDNYLECIEEMQSHYRVTIGNAMAANFAHLVKRFNNGEITREQLSELDRKNMTIRHELLKLLGGENNDQTAGA